MNKDTVTSEIKRLYNHEYEAKMEMSRLEAENKRLTEALIVAWNALNKKSV